MKNHQKIHTNHWTINENIKSPFTNKPMTLKTSFEVFKYKGRNVEIEYQTYFCEESKESFTTTWLDILNRQAIDRQYDLLFINTLVLCEFKVYRLVEIGEDDIDFFYVLDPFLGHKLEHHSILTGFIPLIDNLKAEDYNNLVRRWNLNNVDLVDMIEIDF